MKKSAILAAIFLAGKLFAQAPPAAPAMELADTSWKHSVVSGLTVSQVSFKDWAQGGEDALAWTVRLDGKSQFDDTTLTWANSYKMSYGRAKIGVQQNRKTEDRFELESVLTYKLGTEINPYVSAALKTQFALGQTYDAAGNATSVSKFFDPGYLTQSAGVGYRPSKEFRTRLGIGLREIVTSTYTIYANDPSIPVDKRVTTKVDGGMESVTDGEFKIDDNVLFRSKLELFSPIRKPNEMTMRMDNTLTANISKYIVVILNVQLINDVNATSRVQVKEVLAIGLTYTIF